MDLNKPADEASAVEEETIDVSNQCKRCSLLLPLGLRFDPTDKELMEHLKAKVRDNGAGNHPLIGRFKPSMDIREGIYYTHPQNLPGVNMDDVRKYFFFLPSKAYNCRTKVYLLEGR